MKTYSLQIQCTQSNLGYVTGLYKSDSTNGLQEAKDKARALKDRLFGNKVCKVTVVDEVTTKRYKVK